jgi:hypothetical protein
MQDRKGRMGILHIRRPSNSQVRKSKVGRCLLAIPRHVALWSSCQETPAAEVHLRRHPSRCQRRRSKIGRNGRFPRLGPARVPGSGRYHDVGWLQIEATRSYGKKKKSFSGSSSLGDDILPVSYCSVNLCCDPRPSKSLVSCFDSCGIINNHTCSSIPR